MKTQESDHERRVVSDERRETASKEWGAGMMSWRVLLARTVMVAAIVGMFVGGAVFVGVRLAVADPGGPVTPDALTFAGVLRERIDAGPSALTFIFRKGATPVCTVTTTAFSVDSSGAFSVQVPLGACSDGGVLFDGATIVYDVRLGGAMGELLTPVEGVPITSVPYARFADQVGVNNSCPVGYSLDTGERTYVVCRRPLSGGAVDEIVRVGFGATAFWIDRYEASIWDSRDASGTQYGVTRDDYEGGGRSFPDNGVWVTPLFAVSRRVPLSPSRYVTWYQAQTACRLVGKRLPTRDEWIASANGSPDSADVCRINFPVGGTRNTGGSSCVSRWGAEDMVGNVWEWTDEWFGGAGSHLGDVSDAGVPGDSGTPGSRARWPAGYNNDTVLGVFSYVIATNGDFVRNLPAAAVRGGDFGNSDGAGVFAMEIAEAPSAAYSSIGFRCVIPR